MPVRWISIYAEILRQPVFNIEGCLDLPVRFDAYECIVVDADKLRVRIIYEGLGLF